MFDIQFFLLEIDFRFEIPIVRNEVAGRRIIPESITFGPLDPKGRMRENQGSTEGEERA